MAAVSYSSHVSRVPSQLLVSLAPTVRLVIAADGAPFLQRASPAAAEWRLSPVVGIVASLLSDAPAPYHALARVASEVGGAEGLAEWYVALPELLASGAAHVALVDEAGPMATLLALRDTAMIDFASPGHDQPWALSRFAFLHNEGGTSVLDSAATGARLLVQRPIVAAFVHGTSGGGTVAAWSAHFAGAIDPDGVEGLVCVLAAAGVLVPMVDGVPQERAALIEWEFADALLHHRSRLRRHDDAFGSTYPFRDVRPAAPAVKPPMSTEAIPLARPDLETLVRDDLPFTRVLEARQSQRQHGAAPVSISQLGEFLFRSARVRGVRRSDDGAPYEATSRPYPGGGAAYELEVYIVVAACTGLARGLYHYAPERHVLEPLAVRDADVDAWMQDCRMPVEQWGERQLLILLAARFRRVTWKYRAMAYATVLKDVGVLQQTMALVATAMGLAACPLGSGDGTRLARALATDYFDESTVGELTLGSAADDA